MDPDPATEFPDFLEEAQIDTPEALDAFITRVRDEDGTGWLAVDTEADSMHSYETKLCLIQFASRKRLAVIDPLAIPHEALDPLLRLLDDTEVVWMHGADYDMAMFRKTFGRIPSTVWDTQTAARLTGVKKFGLANLIEGEFGIKLSKQSQKADWGKRPLPQKMLSYAFNDVRYILTMAERYVDRLKAHDRFDWFVESCAAAREDVTKRVEKPADELWRINGWGKLDPRGLAYLRALWHWRDDECRRLDRPAFKLLSNQELLSMSQRAQAGKTISPPRYLRPNVARRLLETVEQAHEVPQSDWPRKFRNNGGTRLQVEEDEYDRLRKVRNHQAEQLDIDPTLIAPRSVLEKLAATNVDESEKNNLLLNWQRQLMDL